MKSAVRAALRGAAALTVDEIMARVAESRPSLSRVPKNPKQGVRNALTNDALCQSAGENRYVYLPTFVRGAAMRAPMDHIAPSKRRLAVGAEVIALLSPLAEIGDRGPTPMLALDGGPTVAVEWHAHTWRIGPRAVIGLPAPFWRWWAGQQRDGADALLIRCEDGEAGLFGVGAVDTGTLDSVAVAASDGRLREATVDMLKRSQQGLWPEDVGRRLLARGLYHEEFVPDPLARVLFSPDEPFFLENGYVTYRPTLTPCLRRLFAPRLLEEQAEADNFVREVLGLPLRKPRLAAPLPPHEPPAEHLVRLKVSLTWDRAVWRVVELLDDETLEDLHLVIQDAFGWDNDHLYAFYLSGHTGDRATRIDGSFYDEAEGPASDEVTLAALDLRPKQRLLYLFDFGDQLEHDIEVLQLLPAPADGVVSRIVESHGEAPPQYPEWDGEDGKDDEVGDDGVAFYIAGPLGGDR